MATTEQTIEAAIMNAVEVRTRQIVEEEIARACEAVARRMRENLAQIVMSVHSHYTVQFDRKEILIHIRNEIEK
jgi:hypothetical protein